MAAHRQEKLAKELMRAISAVLREETQDPRIGFVTVTKVAPSQDLQFAKVFISVLGDEAATKRSLEALGRARSFIRAQIENRMNIRHVPELMFVHDPSIEGSIRISKLIDEAIGEIPPERRNMDAPPPDPAGNLEDQTL